MNVPTLKTSMSNTVMTTATLRTVVRDPRSGEVHLPSERVAIVKVMRNLDRTLVKVTWQAGGDCVVFPEGKSSGLVRLVSVSWQSVASGREQESTRLSGAHVFRPK
jgi:hypothetical protein